MKKLQIIVLAAGVIFLAGCGKKAAENATDTGTGQAVENKTETQKSGVINSIKDAMGLGQTMKCTYSDTMDGKTFVSEAYVKGDNYKAVNEVDGKKMNSLFDGKTIYSWTEGEKKGTRMDIKCFEDMPKPEEKVTNKPAPAALPVEEKKPEDEFKSAQDVKCEPASGIDFNPPTDITFEDQCAALKAMMEKFKDIKVPGGNMPNIPGGNPGNVPDGEIPGAPNTNFSD
jgi:hypothetical protein